MMELDHEATHKFEVALGNLLRTGVLIAAGVVLLGAGLYLAASANVHPDYHKFQSEPANLKSVHQVVYGSAALRPASVLQLGLILLILTPIARVLFSVFVFLKQRDWMYTFFTLIVLGILCYSLLGR